ncbi:MAG: DUF1697 domain-containing protein, partial [Flavobacteriales bacterium]|nr:DUF1697 domain-containing protein [Flavobacteriales bacterium]
MNNQIVLLRGINVSGQKKIAMADLRMWLSELDVTNVQTYIQSGNIVLSSELENKRLSEEIKNKILEKSGFDVVTLTISEDDMQKVFEDNPFTKQVDNGSQVYVTFFGQEPNAENVKSVVDNCPTNELLHFNSKHVYFFSKTGYGTAKMNNNFLEKKIKVSCTTRNWKSVETLLNM